VLLDNLSKFPARQVTESVAAAAAAHPSSPDVSYCKGPDAAESRYVEACVGDDAERKVVKDVAGLKAS
jgi:hypothetical protein